MKRLNKLNQRSGFTLIEIIVVLIIVGILAAIALPNLFSNVKKSRSEEALGAISGFRSPIEACLQAHEATATVDCAANAKWGGFVDTANFTYAFSTAPANGSTDYAIEATGKGALASADTITITSSGGAVSCVGAGALAGAC